MARKKSKGTELSVFKGREARLNRAILQILATSSPQTIYDTHTKENRQKRNLKNTLYANVNTRVRVLEQDGYLRKNGIKETKAGFNAVLYEATSRAYFALILSSLNLDDLILELGENATMTILSEIATRKQK